MKNPALDCLRAAAAVLVLIAHVRQSFLVPAGDTDLGFINSILYLGTSFGHGAVVVFFVLSGYFVGGSVLFSLRGSSFSWSEYLLSRLTRIWLVLIPAILLTALLDGIGTGFFSDRPQYGESSSAQEDGGILRAIANVFFLQPNWVEPYGSNHPLWSIGYEACYYLLFPILLIGVTRGSLVKRTLFAAGGASILFVLGFAGSVLFVVWLVGAAVAWRSDQIRRVLHRCRPGLVILAVWMLAGLLLFTMVLDRMAKAGPYSLGVTTWLLALITAGLIASLLFSGTQQGKSASRVLAFGSWLSGFSYSIYATHMPLLWLIHAFVFPPGVALWRPTALGWAGFAAVCLVAAASAWGFAAATERRTAVVRSRVVRLIGASRSRLGAVKE